MGRGTRIWPFWVKTVGACIDYGAVVRAGCGKCKTIFDVDLHAIAVQRGYNFVLVDQQLRCRVSSCRGKAHFLAAASLADPFMTLINSDEDPVGVAGKRPIDLEPPEDPPRPPAIASARA